MLIDVDNECEGEGHRGVTNAEEVEDRGECESEREEEKEDI